MKYIFIFLALLSVDASAQKTSSDEQHFRLVLKNFKTAVKSRNLNGASKLMQFPFYTAKSDNGNGRELPADPISYNEFKTYKSAIFNEEVLRILLKLREDNLSEIEGNEDNYYAALRKTTEVSFTRFTQNTGSNAETRKAISHSSLDVSEAVIK